MDVPSLSFLVCFVVCIHQALAVPTTQDPHGGVQMGVSNHFCDDAKSYLDVDWDNDTSYDYECQAEENVLPLKNDSPVLECIPKDDMPKPLHKCMSTTITYTDTPPRAGSHRPLWPVYGEYLYVPPQRWIHSLEHGGIVFLHHPCADPKRVEILRSLAQGCLRKHIFTPYRDLPLNKMFAVISYGCRLMMGDVDEDAIVKFVRQYALTAPEHTPREGQYSLGLLHKSDIVTTFEDNGILCPGLPKGKKHEPKVNTKKVLKTNDLVPEEGIDVLEQRLGKRLIM